MLLLQGVAILKAQCDSTLFVNSQFHQESIMEGVTLKQWQFKDSSLFDSNQYISVIEIERGADITFGVAADTILRRTSDFVAQYEAIAAINGSFFKFGVPYNSVDYLRIGGQELAPNELGDKNKRLMHQQGAVAISRGWLYVVKADDTSDWERYIYAEDVLTSGPYLLNDGQREGLRDQSHYTTRHPRTAAATADNNSKVILMVVDGRAAEAAGMSLKELQSILKWLGAENAISLDGGGSSALFIEGAGIVNHPTDNRTFDHNGERRVANTIMIYNK